MSYNGIGLQTPRGSGTSGYVQKSIADRKNEGFRQKRDREAFEEERREVKARHTEIRRNAGTEILDHNNKRWIEVQCMELRDKLEDRDVDDDEINKKVANLRQKLTKMQAKPAAGSIKKLDRDGEKSTGESEEKTSKSENVNPTEQVKEEQITPVETNSENTTEGKAPESPDSKTPKDLNEPVSTYSYVPRYSQR